MVENCLEVFFEPHLGQGALGAVELETSLSKAVSQSSQAYS